MERGDLKVERKKLMHLFVIVVLLLSGIIVSDDNNKAYACSCAVAPGDYEDALEKYDYVFDGVVTKKKEKKSLLGTMSTGDPVAWTFQVNGAWKGEATELMTIYSAAGGASCGYEFKVGKRYAVFAQDREGTIEVSLCSSTSSIADNSSIFTEIGDYETTFALSPIPDEHIDDKALEPVSPDERVEEKAIDPVSPEAVVKIATEEEVKQSIQDRKTVLTIVFVVVGCLFIIGAFVLIRKMIRK